MLNIIVLLVAGSAFAYISKDNLSPVTLNIANYTFADIPLFYVIVGSLLVGLVLSYIVQIFGSIANAFVLRGNRQAMKSGQDEVLELTKRIHQLELENEKLKHENPTILDANAL
ncbi:MAG: bZIP transcription factor [Microgenomates group bacterium]